jgi:hypothetical protein
MQLRCKGNKLHALVVEEDDVKPQGTIEFRCNSKFCGKEPGTIVLHRFDLETGEYHTRRYKEPPTPRKGA